MTYCHKHRRHNCQTCIDELVSLGIQEDKERIAALESKVADLEPDAERYRILCQESLTCWREGNGVGLVIPQQWHSEAQELKEHCDECVDAFIAETKRLIQVATR